MLPLLCGQSSERQSALPKVTQVGWQSWDQLSRGGFS